VTDFQRGVLAGTFGWAAHAQAVTFGTGLIDNSGDKHAAVFQVPEDATITHLWTNVSTVTSPPVCKISLQGIDASGVPDGTVKGGGSPASVTFTPAAGVTWHALANSYAAVRGEILAIVIEYDSGTVGASNTATFLVTTSTLTQRLGVPYYSSKNDAGAFGKTATTGPLFGYKTASKSFGRPFKTASLSKATSTTVEYAQRFSLAAGYGATKKLVGIRYWGGNATTGTQTTWITLYSGTDVLQQIGLDADYAASAGATSREHEVYFDEANLTALDFGTEYRVGIIASTAASINALDVENDGDMGAFPFGTQIYASTRTLGAAVTAGSGPASGGAAWTDSPKERLYMDLILEDWTEPAAGGGGMLVHPGMSGGLRG
jgi:hypothetical protein